MNTLNHTLSPTIPSYPHHIHLDNRAISGITGSISISFWIIVFVPQIYENYVRKSSEGLSLLFVVLWLIGDIFNVLGGVLQGVLGTMIILAIYYTLADLILLAQFFLYPDHNNSVDALHLNPANPLSETVLDEIAQDVLGEDLESSNSAMSTDNHALPRVRKTKKKSNYKSLIEFSLVSGVIFAGVIGWYVTYNPTENDNRNGNGNGDGNGSGDGHQGSDLTFDPLAQFFGWLSAVLYLGSRMPQILLNFQRKSCEGISFLFFLCACLGNLTYVISILAVSTSWEYLRVQASWLTGSIGTLALDFVIFLQFFVYNQEDDDGGFDDISHQ